MSPLQPGQLAEFTSHLQGLPDAFAGALFANSIGVAELEAKAHLERLAEAGILQESGPGTGFFYNVFTNKKAPAECLSEALLHVYPSAVVRSATVLHALGKTTQVSHQVIVAVLAPADRTNTTGFEERPRGQRWFDTVQGLMLEDGLFGLFGLPALQPEAALADMYASPDDWHPDIDDLDVDELDWVKFNGACDVLGVEVPEQLSELVASAVAGAVAGAVSGPMKQPAPPARRRVRP